MGTICFKPQKRTEIDIGGGGDHVPRIHPGPANNSVTKGNDINWEDLVNKNGEYLYEEMNKQLDATPVRFLINNIAMSVQFLRDFDKDKSEIYRTKDAQKDDFDERLSEMKKRCIISGTIFTKVNDYVSLRTWRQEEASGALVPVLNPIVPNEYYLCYTNIELDSQMRSPPQDGEDSMNYANLNDRTYRGALEGFEDDEETENNHIGYVKVVCFEPKGGLVPKETEEGGAGSTPATPRTPKTPDDGITDDRNGHDVPNTADDKSKQTGTEVKEHSIPNKSPRPGYHFFQDNFLEDLAEEDEDEDGEAEMEAFKNRLKALDKCDNYVKPLSNQVARQEIPTYKDVQNINVSMPAGFNQGRRGSGFLPDSYLAQQAKQEEMRRKLKQKKLNGIDGIPEKPKRKEEDNLLKPTTQNVADNQDIYVLLRKQPLYKSSDNTRSSRGSIIPENCFEHRVVSNPEDDEDGENDDDEEKTRLYLSSQGMMKYFQQQFPIICDKLDKSDYKTPSINSAIEVLPPDIFCRVLESEKEEVERYEETKVTPSIDCAGFPFNGIEWKHRSRPVMTDKRTKLEYRWPTTDQKEAVLTLGFNIVPVGFTHPKKSMVNKNMDIEWQIRFIKAEQFLAKNLHYPKIKVYLLLLVLFKKYIEPLESITEEHLRHVFYRKVESEPTNWTEENAGDKLLSILTALYESLVEKKIQNFFLYKSNMLASLANHKIWAAQEKLHSILESPVFYLLAALNDLHCEKNFYPSVGSLTENLYSVLNSDRTTLLTTNIMSEGSKIKSEHMGKVNITQIEDDYPITKSDNEPRDIYQRRMSKAREKIAEEKRQKKEQVADSQIVEEEMKKTDSWLQTIMKIDKDPIRWKHVISIFLRHFLDMAEKSNTFRNQGQAYMYYQQANNLFRRLVHLNYADYQGGGAYRKEYIRLESLSHNMTEMSKKDYWDISFSHPKLNKSASFRSDHRLSIPLPTPPSDESPIPGTKRQDEESVDEIINKAEVNNKDNNMKTNNINISINTTTQISADVHNSDASDDDDNDFFVTRC